MVIVVVIVIVVVLVVAVVVVVVGLVDLSAHDWSVLRRADRPCEFLGMMRGLRSGFPSRDLSNGFSSQRGEAETASSARIASGKSRSWKKTFAQNQDEFLQAMGPEMDATDRVMMPCWAAISPDLAVGHVSASQKSCTPTQGSIAEAVCKRQGIETAGTNVETTIAQQRDFIPEGAVPEAEMDVESRSAGPARRLRRKQKITEGGANGAIAREKGAGVTRRAEQVPGAEGAIVAAQVVEVVAVVAADSHAGQAKSKRKRRSDRVEWERERRYYRSAPYVALAGNYAQLFAFCSDIKDGTTPLHTPVPPGAILPDSEAVKANKYHDEAEAYWTRAAARRKKLEEAKAKNKDHKPVKRKGVATHARRGKAPKDPELRAQKTTQHNMRKR